MARTSTEQKAVAGTEDLSEGQEAREEAEGPLEERALKDKEAVPEKAKTEPGPQPHRKSGTKTGQTTVKTVQFQQLTPSDQKGAAQNIDILLDVTLPVSIELGRTTMQIKDILKLTKGSIIELDKSAGEPVDLIINNKLLAKGEVVLIEENFGIRITELGSPAERIKSL